MTAWRPVPGWEDLYQVSDEGVVLSIRAGKPMKTFFRKYLQVKLSRNGQRKGYTIHRLVALAFLGPCPPGMEICHNDGNKLNNSLANLRYGTSSENNLDRVQHGRHHNANKTHCKHGHPFDTANTEIGRDGSRHCKTCHRIRDRKTKRRSRAAARAAQYAVTDSLFSTWRPH